MKEGFKTTIKKPGFLLSLPYVFHLMIFFVYPVVFSVIIIFHRWDVVTPMEFVGLRNFERIFADEVFLQSLINTGVFLLLHIPLQIVIALFFAVQLNERIPFRGFFRTLYFLPVVVSGVVVTILFQQLFSYDTGILNLFLNKLGIPRIPWLVSEYWAMPSIALMATWKNVGLYVILFLAGLQSIPKELYEAAELDGAGSVQRFFRITLPMLNPTVVTVVVLSVIGGFSLFIEPYVMTGGGPMDSTLSAMLYIYNQAFNFGHMGYAATMGLFFAAIIFTVVSVQRKFVETELYQ
ncbi:MAG: sugar ABC transporter permease [Balneolales bacterium]|nr:sugar ABC transporter permease [Balneolales bacterium]